MLVVASSVDETSKGFFDGEAVSDVSTNSSENLESDRVQPSDPLVLTKSDIVAESREDEDFECVDVLERNSRNGRESFVAVRVVLQRL